jgi:hypothetical protein
LSAYWNTQLRSVEVDHNDWATIHGYVNGRYIAVQFNSSQRFTTINEIAVKLSKLSTISRPKSNAWAGDETAPDQQAWDRYSDNLAIIDNMVIAGEHFNNVFLRIKSNSKVPMIPGKPIGTFIMYGDEPPTIVLGMDYLLTHHIMISTLQHLAFISPTGGAPFEAAQSTPPTGGLNSIRVSP